MIRLLLFTNIPGDGPAGAGGQSPRTGVGR